MKDELKAMQAYLKELDALRRYDEVKTLSQEVSELKAKLSEIRGERDRLKSEVLDSKKTKEEVRQLKEALEQAQEELSMLKEAKAILEKGTATLEEAAREFIKAKEAEISARVEREFESKAPKLVHQRLLATLKKPEWPAEIAQVIEEKAEEKAKSRLDDEFQHRVDGEALGRLQQLKLTEWWPFVEEEASHLVSSLRAVVLELQGAWQFICDRCGTRVSVDIGPRQIASLLKGERVAECPQCRDFNLPPAPPIAPHKIEGSALEGLLEAYLAGKGPPGKAATEGT